MLWVQCRIEEGEHVRALGFGERLRNVIFDLETSDVIMIPYCPWMPTMSLHNTEPINTLSEINEAPRCLSPFLLHYWLLMGSGGRTDTVF